MTGKHVKRQGELGETHEAMRARTEHAMVNELRRLGYVVLTREEANRLSVLVNRDVRTLAETNEALALLSPDEADEPKPRSDEDFDPRVGDAVDPDFDWDKEIAEMEC